MSITLRQDTQQKIEDRMKTGPYKTPDEVVNAALRSLDEREKDEAAELEELRRQIAIGVQQLEQGQGIDAEQVFDELLAGLDD